MPDEPILPPEEEPVVPPAEERKLIDELQKMEYEPLLPVEKKLIGWSIAIGVIALGSPDLDQLHLLPRPALIC